MEPHKQAEPIQCPYCFGRGYQCTYPKTGRLKIRVVDCRSCRGTGQIEPSAPNYKRACRSVGKEI